MSYRTGIIAALDGKTISDEPLAYRSDNGHIMVDPRPEARNLGIWEGYCGTTSLSVANGEIKEEVFFEVEHHLPFIPRASAYMYIRDAPASVASYVGKYAGSFIYAFGFPYNEVVFLRVNERYIRLVHQAENASSTAYVSILQNMKIRAKYIVNSNEAAGEPYDITLPFL